MPGAARPASAPFTDLSANTTDHLVADVERLRAHLGVDRWLVWGFSWGVTLGTGLRGAAPARVSAMVLGRSRRPGRPDVTGSTTRPAASSRRSGRLPAGCPAGARGDLVAAYHRLLHEHPTLAVRARAARDWCAWEDAVQSLEPGWAPHPRYADPAFRMTFARLVTHYFHHRAWLADGQLLARPTA